MLYKVLSYYNQEYFIRFTVLVKSIQMSELSASISTLEMIKTQTFESQQKQERGSALWRHTDGAK